MKCPSCGSLNADGAKFCKKCGASLESVKLNIIESSNNVQNEKKSSKNILIIAVAVIICVAIVAGAFVMLNENSNDEPTVVNTTTDNTPQNSLKILGFGITTGSSLSDKTVAAVQIGQEHAGETIKITAIYSRNGHNLNDGNILTKTVASDGFVQFNSAEAFNQYPDHATVKLYNVDGTLADTKDVELNPTSGTQSFNF